jgi:hypothetical protein
VDVIERAVALIGLKLLSYCRCRLVIRVQLYAFVGYQSSIFPSYTLKNVKVLKQTRNETPCWRFQFLDHPSWPANMDGLL